jgi:hypothetical protein
MLLARGANGSIRGGLARSTPLEEAVSGGHTAAAAALYDRASAEERRGMLHAAVGSSHIEVIQMLLAKGMDPNEPTEQGDTHSTRRPNMATSRECLPSY